MVAYVSEDVQQVHVSEESVACGLIGLSAHKRSEQLNY